MLAESPVRALIVGLDPALLDGQPAADGVTSSRVRANMDAAVATLAERGIEADLFLLPGAHDEVAVELGRVVGRMRPAAVMIGAGVRLEPSLSWFLERLVNATVAASPTARLCFNEDPESMATAVLRVLEPRAAD